MYLYVSLIYDYIGNFYLRQMFGERVLEGKLLSTMCAGISGGGEDDKGVEKNDSLGKSCLATLGGGRGRKEKARNASQRPWQIKQWQQFP